MCYICSTKYLVVQIADLAIIAIITNLAGDKLRIKRVFHNDC